MKINVYFLNGKLMTSIDMSKPNTYLPDERWTDDVVDIVCHRWQRHGFIVHLSK